MSAIDMNGDDPLDRLPGPLRGYVRVVEAVNRVIGRITMYMIFAMMAVLLWSSISKGLFIPSLWTLEIAQFMMVAYFLMGGAYSMQLDAHVRMDLLYGQWSTRTQTWVDSITILFLIFYLFWLLYGGWSSTSYAIEYGERSYSSWRPYMWPIKVVMCIGIFMMLTQTVATLLRDIAKLRGGKAS